MILVIHRTNEFQKIITGCLSNQRFLHDVVSSFHCAHSLLKAQHYSLIIVETFKGSDCVTRFSELVRSHPDSWVMAVECNAIATDSASVDEVEYFDVGVDDYLKGPFNERAFIARIRSHMRRSMPSLCSNLGTQLSDERIEIGPLRVDPRYHSVTLNGQTLPLTAREFTLLDYFCRHPNQVFSRHQLLNAVWGYNHEGYEHTVNSHINRLRAKLDKVQSIENGARLVQTVWGVGYKLNVSGYVAKAALM
ncbi:hypothetical protein D210916BOD24_04330 [Alteromonas sp. D210916BOD_24]|uniref:winged helix-turn-helix transcriptional regulator n=1 Tax=Alteromonas sp. D210916BOD_24 TaxID=3157618 RepID=UPI00399D4C3F